MVYIEPGLPCTACLWGAVTPSEVRTSGRSQDTHNVTFTLCRLQFETTLKKALELADSIDKNGPDRATDMQVQNTSSHALLWRLMRLPDSQPHVQY